jgi:hypothetical protein
MPRPRTVTAAAVVQGLFALGAAGGSVAFLTLVRSDTEHEAIIGGLFFCGLTAIFATGSAGLWRARRWAWWLALLSDLSIILFALWDTFIDHDRDPDNWIVVAVFLVAIAMLFMPGVRRFFFALQPAIVSEHST